MNVAWIDVCRALLALDPPPHRSHDFPPLSESPEEYISGPYFYEKK